MEEHETDQPEPDSIVREHAQSRKREREAEDDLRFHEQRLGNQRKHLKNMLSYRSECASGLRSAAHDLTVAQIRDYELLLQHLDRVVEIQQQRVEASRKDYEARRAEWLHVRDLNRRIDSQLTERQREKREQYQPAAEPPKTAAKVQIKPDNDEPGKIINPSYR